jgi:hypothetical protein
MRGGLGSSIECQALDRYRSMTNLQGECSFMRLVLARRMNVGRVLVLNRHRSMTYLQGECSFVRVVSARRLNDGRVLVLNNPPAWAAHTSSAPAAISSSMA